LAPILLPRFLGVSRRFFEQAVHDQARLTPVPPLAELSSTTAIKSAAAAGAGATVLSSLAVAGELTAGTLGAVPVIGLNLNRVLRAVWPAGRRLIGLAQDLSTIAACSGRPG
jgi:DNA-binding transcriptional LysR family regulator